MDLGAIHGIWTVVLLVVFAGIVVWAFGRTRRDAFESAARIPFEDDDEEVRGTRRATASRNRNPGNRDG
ncbi:MAG: cbb3-type cytochrome c oxidase subunit 3 [Ectothiorhodospiraceae bacterium]|nr:cbb3-type cytochrome c oxidase subunit 3 [Chromatiales bacterium]MCP5153782.1 cbb3-type cytochrome c oxidase subunit 3 [Ectothiorhodospiraceae bacterium]